jgi:hypothetical protein
MKRTSYLKHDEEVELGKRGLTVWGYGRNKRFVCRLEINAAGVAVYTGSKGRKKLTNASWEKFVQTLSMNGRRRSA